METRAESFYRTPIKAIRFHCRECKSMQTKPLKAIRFCEIYKCNLFPYRMGHNPWREGVVGCDIHTKKSVKVIRKGS